MAFLYNKKMARFGRDRGVFLGCLVPGGTRRDKKLKAHVSPRQYWSFLSRDKRDKAGQAQLSRCPTPYRGGQWRDTRFWEHDGAAQDDQFDLTLPTQRQPHVEAHKDWESLLDRPGQALLRTGASGGEGSRCSGWNCITRGGQVPAASARQSQAGHGQRLEGAFGRTNQGKSVGRRSPDQAAAPGVDASLQGWQSRGVCRTT